MDSAVSQRTMLRSRFSDVQVRVAHILVILVPYSCRSKLKYCSTRARNNGGKKRGESILNVFVEQCVQRWCSKMKPVTFVPARQGEEHDSAKKRKRLAVNRKNSEQDGIEARAFYESLLQQSREPEETGRESKDISTTTQNSTNVIRSKPEVKVPKQSHSRCASRGMTRAEVDLEARLRKGSSDFLRCAQLGDLIALKLHLERGVYVDVQDQYGWTALMCAVREGQGEVAQFLLETGADVNIRDNQGRSVLDVAESTINKSSKHESATEVKQKRDCREMVRRYTGGAHDWRIKTDDDQSERETFFCFECQKEFSDTTRAKHVTTTIHLFNTKPQSSQGAFYHLTENNKGFKLMVQSGWDRDKGLGPEGKEGHKYPVKTVLKRDRLGLGNTDNKSAAKVTHFGPNDEAAVKRPQRDEVAKKRTMKQSTLSKKQRAKQLSKDREKEMKFRMEFSLDS